MKALLVVCRLLLVLFLSSLFCSCGDGDAPEPIRYHWGITSQSSSDSNDIETLSPAYSDAFNTKGLHNDTRYFVVGTSSEQILEACKLAEHSLETSAYKFQGRYVIEVISSEDKSIYLQVWGARQF